MLILSFCMPPLKYPRSIQISRLIKNMPIKPSVIYASETTNLDFTILENFDNYVDTKIQIPFKNENRYISFFKRKLLPIFYQTPDHQIYWSKELYHVAKTYLKTNNENVIVSFGQPMSVHLAALKLKKKNPMLKWIAHFSDPWVDNPLNKKGFFIKKINKYLEENVFKYADRIIFTSNETIELVSENYSSNITNKMVYLPHSYDKDNYNYTLKNKTNKFIIRYIGGFYSQRSPKPLFEAISYILKVDKKLLDNVLFEIVGSLGKHSRLLSSYEDINDYINIVDNVSYEISLELMMSSNVLLVIDAPANKSVFFPSKLVDYIGSKKPIIAITPSGTSKNIIDDLGGKTADPKSNEEIVSMLRGVLLNKNFYKSFKENKSYQRYDSLKITQEFMEIINNV